MVALEKFKANPDAAITAGTMISRCSRSVCGSGSLEQLGRSDICAACGRYAFHILILLLRDSRSLGMPRMLLLMVVLCLLQTKTPIAQPISAASGGADGGVPIQIGESVITLNGPWRFHTGDDARWADPTFDDSGWEKMDLTAAAGAHDSDVGLTGYVSGWTARGHAGYSGYAWYRMRVLVTAPAGAELALAGPPLVDDAYEMFVNGRLLGSDGDFRRAPPTVYSIQPRLFPLGHAGSADGFSAVIAFRVWLSAATLRDSLEDAGGIHIAPALGEAGAIAGRYRLQWLQTVTGYVVDAVEPLMFVLLAIFAWVLIAFDRGDDAYQWLIAAFMLTAMVRVNQVVFFWAQWESLRVFDVAKNVILVPLMLAAWTLAWSAWFRRRVRAGLLYFVAVTTILYLGLELTSRTEVVASSSHIAAAFGWFSNGLRLVYLGVMAGVGFEAIRRRQNEVWITLTAMVLVAAGLFAQELSALHVPGIWFPFGTGVSRTQYVYAIFDVVMFGLLLRRLLSFARR
jgi:hypothetical protein